MVVVVWWGCEGEGVVLFILLYILQMGEIWEGGVVCKPFLSTQKLITKFSLAMVCGTKCSFNRSVQKVEKELN